MTPTGQALLNMARRLGYTVELTTRLPKQQAGAIHPRRRIIYIAADLDPHEREITLAHEIAHALLGHQTHQTPAVENKVEQLGLCILSSL
ncbi:ImmA/IrrE family metallo-endopeptidase [Mobiluncus porci]|uniref:ImmA/IrrE family metallo-endopeptidase n=1 Tax=Mobiluncus porci TaxID=2652278 RepID=UPI00389A21B8